jgi:hypothetical protein
MYAYVYVLAGEITAAKRRQDEAIREADAARKKIVLSKEDGKLEGIRTAYLHMHMYDCTYVYVQWCIVVRFARVLRRMCVC